MGGACDFDCGYCHECHESNGALCENCGDCLFVKEQCEEHEYSCFDCHEDYLCLDCKQCFAEDESMRCESCGYCMDCALNNEMHCPECEACYEEVGRCEDDGEHCRECCENNEWLCEFCDHCTEAMGQDRCSECGACEDCVLDYALHCANCGTCLYDEYPVESTRPEYCESCMPTDEGIPCVVCGERMEENGCTISNDGWHCAEHCQACPFCNDVCFAENPSAACPDCGACPACVADRSLHCANCGTCLYSEYPDDNDRPELCATCATAGDLRCVVCGKRIRENGCTVSSNGWHCAAHCSPCPFCNAVCMAEATPCPLCGRCSVCCTGHDDVDATVINDLDEDLSQFLAAIEPIQDGRIYEGELGDSLDLTNYSGSDVTWIPTFFPNLKEFRCTSVAQLNALTDAQRANLEALYCPSISLTTLDLSKYPNLKILDCSGNQLSTLNVNSCTGLQSLNCGNNRFTTLDVSQCAQLHTLYCNNNKITTLDLSNCPQLRNLNCSNSWLTALNVDNCTNLENLTCGNNKFTSLDVSSCTNLKSLNCGGKFGGTKLTSLNISGCTGLQSLVCSENQLTTLDLTGFTNLTTLNCGSNQIVALELGGNTNLTSLDCHENQLTVLNLSNNKNLSTLKCGNNQLTELNLTGFANLTKLDCSFNLLNDLDLSGCPKLTSLSCGKSDDNTTSLDLSNCDGLTELICYSPLTELGLTGCSQLENIQLYGSEFDELDLSNSPKLKHIELSCEYLLTLDISNCPKLEYFYMSDADNLETVTAGNNPKLTYFCIDATGGSTISSVDLSNCVRLATVAIGTYAPFDIDLFGSGNLEEILIPGSGCIFDLESLQLNRYKKLKTVYIRTDEMPCSFTFNSLLGMNDANVTNVQGATKQGSKWIVDANAESLSFDYGDNSSYIFFNKIKHTNPTNQSYTFFTNATNYSNGHYDHKFDCEGCGNNCTENIWYTKQQGVFLDVCGMRGSMTWVQYYSDLKGYRCDKKEHIDALSPNQKQQLTQLYICNGLEFDATKFTNLETLSYSTYDLNHASMDGYWIDLKNCTRLKNLSVCNNFRVGIDNLHRCTQLKSICIKGNADIGFMNSIENNDYLHEIDLSGCSAQLERIETDNDYLNLRNCPRLRYVDAPYGAVKFPEKAPLDTVILRGAVPCTPAPAEVDDLAYFDPNIDMSRIYNIVGAEYNGGSNKWNISKGSTAITYYYNGQKHYIGFDYSHTPGKHTYSGVKSKMRAEDDYIGTYNCKYACTQCGKSITENNKFTEVGGIRLDVTGWSQDEWNDNKSWIQKYSLAVSSVKYDANTTQVMSVMYWGLKEIHIPNAGLNNLGNNRKFSDFDDLQVLDCPGNNFATIDLSSNREIVYVDCRNSNVSNLSFCSQNNYKSTLRYLDCGWNDITTLDVSKHTELETLICDVYNELDLNISNNTKLEKLSCWVSSINLSNAPELRWLSTEQSQLVSLDVSNNPKLEYLNCMCDDGTLTELDLSNNTRLKWLDFSGNTELESVDVSHLNKLEHLCCSLVGYDNLDLSNCPNLTYLYCSACSLAALDLSHNPKIRALNCTGNMLEELDLSHNADLRSFDCSRNLLTELDLSSNTKLVSLGCGENQLTELDLSSNTKLVGLYCAENQLTELDLSGFAGLKNLECNNNQLRILKLYNGGVNMNSIRCNSNRLTDLDISKFVGGGWTYSTAWIQYNNLLYFDIPKIKFNYTLTSSPNFYNQTRHIESLPCTFRFADLAAGMKDTCVYDYVGIEPYTDGKTTMWRITATDGRITYYYNNGNSKVPDVQHTLTFDGITHKYSASNRYYTDTVPATYDATGSCIMHTPCAYCSEELTETVVFDKLLCNVTVKDAHCPVEMAMGGEFVPISTLGNYSAKGGLVNMKMEKGTEIQLKAVADAGHHFVKWSDGNTNPQRAFVVSSDTTLSAEFEAHTVVIDPAVAATTTSTGLTEGSHCSVCHVTIVAQTEIPVLSEQGGNNEGGNNQGGENQGGNNEGGNNQGGENQGGNNEGGNNQGGENNPATAVDDVIAEAVSIYTIDGNTIVVENATDEIRVYDAMGRLICRDATPCVRAEMNVNVSGIYIVRVGNVAKRVMVNE